MTRSAPLGLLAAALLAAGPALAHSEADPAVWPSWRPDPLVLGGLLAAACLYGRGAAGIWRRAGFGRGLRPQQFALFAAGLAALLVALVGPLEGAATDLLAAHMVQHMLLMVVAAPLLILAAPQTALLWGLPQAWRRRLGKGMQALARHGAWRALRHPGVATLLQAGALWAWHTPALFNWASASWAAHSLQHLSFLAAACLFWSALLHPLSRGRAGYAAGLPWIFLTLMQAGLLGAILTLAPRPLYAARPEEWGLSALTDQQLAGSIMWVPGCAAYLAAAIGLVAACLAPPVRGAR